MRASFLSASTALAILSTGSIASAANTLQVGPNQQYAKPCDAIAAAQAGDTIEVDAAGSYNGDTCSWSTDNLTIRGVNGRAKIDLTGVTPSGQKGIFTIEGNASATIESFELSGAAISASAGNNGAGIRHQGLNLTVRDCYIHDNQDGILAAPATANTGTILIENSEFSHNGAGDGYSHNMYIGDFASFTLQYSYSHDGNVGHLFKSRAYTTSVLYNRITDETGGTASYEIDIPNAGTAYVIGNIVEQSATTQNPAILSFGEEGVPSGYDTHLFVVNNTFLNDKGSGTFVVDPTSTPASIENNIFNGGGALTSQATATSTTNFDSTTAGNPMFTNLASYDVTLQSGSPCIDKGTMPGSNGNQSLAPVFEYVHPLSEVPRMVEGSAIDIGAYEYGLADDAGVIGPDAATPDSGHSGGSSGGGSGSSSGSTGSSSGGTGSGSGSTGSSSGSTGSGSGSTGSSSGVSGSGGGSSGGADAGDEGGSGNGATSSNSGGCACATIGSAGSSTLGLLGLGLAAGLIVSSRRRKGR